MKDNIKIIIASMLLTAAVIASNSSYDDEELLETEYCQMVNGGHWENFKNLECEK
jgi:hypothetical protein